jgi:hypothetical protein
MYWKPDTPFLNRFTTLPVLLDMLSRSCITLLEPTNWEDRNDAFYLNKYKATKNLKTLLACCFSTKRETFHHWKVFSNGPSGVCIQFDSDKLLTSVETIKGTSFKMVSYRFIMTNQNPPLGAWPFLKRHAFKDEGEFRIIYENDLREEKAKEILFDLECIEKITLSPWMPKPIVKSVVKIIRDIEDCESIKVVASTLLEDRRWKNCLWA